MSDRLEPYTRRGLKRIPCAKCGEPSAYQWQICADGNVYRGICAEHDIELNTMVMRWMFGDTKETEIEAYRKRVGMEQSDGRR